MDVSLVLRAHSQRNRVRSRSSRSVERYGNLAIAHPPTCGPLRGRRPIHTECQYLPLPPTLAPCGMVGRSLRGFSMSQQQIVVGLFSGGVATFVAPDGRPLTTGIRKSPITNGLLDAEGFR